TSGLLQERNAQLYGPEVDRCAPTISENFFGQDRSEGGRRLNGKLSPAVQALIEPQERFDRLYHFWIRRAGRNACDFAYANPCEGPDATVKKVIEEALHSPRPLALQYTPYGGQTITRRLIAERLNQTHGEPFCWQDVILTPGAMAALNIVFRILRTEGQDEVVALVPCWMDYPLYLAQLGFKPVLVPLSRGFRFDFTRIEQAVSTATRAIVFSQPANPTGVIYSDEELARL